jgi:Transposase IS66 family
MPRFLHSLQCWAMYQHVVNRTTLENLEGIFKECFGLTVPTAEIHRFKYNLGRYYRSTYASILKRIVSGNLVQADETGMRLKREKGYVWVLTNNLGVYFMFKDSREGDFLGPLLKGFTGVLVSDFYAAYDSIPCPQQKCLVHLIRDFNGDLLANFHDEELRELAKRFSGLLVDIVSTIDKRGLRRRYLQKHKADVQKFFGELSERTFQSEVAQKYRKRLLKNQEKLFVFLDHDDVPWHNNNAEHAIKHFARYRMITNGRVTANGIRPYLVLLSIYQTCNYNDVSFLRFLLSGQKDLDAYIQSQQSRRRGRCVAVAPDPAADGTQ